MDRYLIESPHEAQECKKLLKDMLANGYLHHFEWGCPEGTHVGWAIIEAESAAQAFLAVPPLVRHKARVVKLKRYEESEVMSWH